MNNYSYLIIEHTVFENDINNLITEGNALIEQPVENDDELLSFSKEKDQWENQVQDVLKRSFATPKNSFVYEFYNTHGEQSFHLTGVGEKRPVSIRVENLKTTIKRKIEYLIYNLHIIAVCDYISMGAKLDISKRLQYTTEEKLELILDKLYQLNDGSFYPIDMLLEGNGIKLKSSIESRELINILEGHNYVESSGGLGVGPAARITAEGSMYVEKKGTPHSEDYSDIPNNQEDINKKVDEIIEKLSTLGLGQEILFEELQELKSLYSKLNKKNWGQLLKGKLVDLALAKLIENDTIKFIYEKFTGSELKSLL